MPDYYVLIVVHSHSNYVGVFTVLQTADCCMLNKTHIAPTKSQSANCNRYDSLRSDSTSSADIRVIVSKPSQMCDDVYQNCDT
jgi:hypothetical protein